MINCIVPLGFSSMGNSDWLLCGKPAVTESRYPTYMHAGCLNVSMVHQILTWTTGSLMGTHICQYVQLYTGVYGHTNRVCTESWFWEKNPLLRQGIEPASAACQSDALPTELHPRSGLWRDGWKSLILSQPQCNCLKGILIFALCVLWSLTTQSLSLSGIWCWVWWRVVLCCCCFWGVNFPHPSPPSPFFCFVLSLWIHFF